MISHRKRKSQDKDMAQHALITRCIVATSHARMGAFFVSLPLLSFHLRPLTHLVRKVMND